MLDMIIFSNTLTSFVFHSLSDLEYGMNEFQWLFIYLCASNQFTYNICQQKTFDQLDNSIELNKNTARSDNFIF